MDKNINNAAVLVFDWFSDLYAAIWLDPYARPAHPPFWFEQRYHFSNLKQICSWNFMWFCVKITELILFWLGGVPWCQQFLFLNDKVCTSKWIENPHFLVPGWLHSGSRTNHQSSNRMDHILQWQLCKLLPMERHPRQRSTNLPEAYGNIQEHKTIGWAEPAGVICSESARFARRARRAVANHRDSKWLSRGRLLIDILFWLLSRKIGWTKIHILILRVFTQSDDLILAEPFSQAGSRFSDDPWPSNSCDFLYYPNSNLNLSDWPE